MNWLVRRLERVLDWHSNLDPETARTVMVTVSSSLLTLVVLVTSAMLRVVQLASAQLTPRIVSSIARSRRMT